MDKIRRKAGMVVFSEECRIFDVFATLAIACKPEPARLVIEASVQRQFEGSGFVVVADDEDSASQGDVVPSFTRKRRELG